MSTAIGEKRLSTKPAEQDARQRARQSKAHPDCRSTTIKSRVTKISLALSSGRDNHPPAATAEMAIQIVAVQHPPKAELSMASLRLLVANGCRPALPKTGLALSCKHMSTAFCPD